VKRCYSWLKNLCTRVLVLLMVTRISCPIRSRGAVSLTNSFIPRKTLCHPLQGILNVFHSLFKINTKRKYPTSVRTKTPVIPTNSLSPNSVNYHRSIICIHNHTAQSNEKKHGMLQDSNEKHVPKTPCTSTYPQHSVVTLKY
jgi:hypothetical protein